MLKKLIENSKLCLDMLDGSEGSEEDIKCFEDRLIERFGMPIKNIYSIVIKLNATPILLDYKLLHCILFFNFKNSIEIFDNFIGRFCEMRNIFRYSKLDISGYISIDG